MRHVYTLCLLFIAIPPAFPQTPASGGLPWPRQLDAGGSHFVIYQPQPESWENNQLRARSAVTASQATGKPAYGLISITARTREDRDHRNVTMEDLKVVSADFPSAAAQQDRYLAEIRADVAQWPRSIPADRLRAELAAAGTQNHVGNDEIRNSPGKIIYSPRRAVLILVDGEPVFRPVEGSGYTRVINTPAMLLFDSSAKRFYLDGDGRWMTATALNGPWTAAEAPPGDLDEVKARISKSDNPDQENSQTHTAAPAAANRPGAAVIPRAFVSTEPAELIQTRGPARFLPIAQTNLTYVTNSENDIFMDVKAQEYYTVLEGRWFQAKELKGPWAPIANTELPRDFSLIPPDSAKASVLASVAGTAQAREAVIANDVPQTAQVKRKQAKLTVRYDGEPQFRPISGTSLEYAVNTSTEVVHSGGRYYACHNAVWFVSDTPSGPWMVADTIPAEIYRIPASSPLYHLRYVYVYGATPDFVWFGYTPGYLGAFVWRGTVVFGTGWAYPAWYGAAYYGWPWTWGFGFRFGYWGGGWFWRPAGLWWYNHPWFAARVWYGGWYPRGFVANRVFVQNVNVYNRWQRTTVVSNSYRASAVGPSSARVASTGPASARDASVANRPAMAQSRRPAAGAGARSGGRMPAARRGGR